MMSDDSKALAVSLNGAAILESVITKGNLADLTAKDRVTYYAETCKSLGINPLTKPFEYITLNGKLVLYATRGATDQLRAVHHVAITRLERETVGDVFMVTASARLPDGRTDESIGAVSMKGLAGDALANAYMKAETKAKRRVTLSIVGLGWLDESEIETIPTARRVAVNTETGEIAEPTIHVPQTVLPVTTAPPPRPPDPTPLPDLSFAEARANYLRVVDVADDNDVPAEQFDPGWPVDEIVAKGKRLADAIRAKRAKSHHDRTQENALAEMGSGK